jgi:hypothetical protein
MKLDSKHNPKPKKTKVEDLRK